MDDPAGTQRARCRGCGAPVLWGVTGANEKPIPLDPEPRADGNLVVEARMVVAYSQLLHVGVPRYVTHFATCAKAAEFRK